MADYLEDAATALHQAKSRAEILADKSRGSELLLRVADGFTRLAAIERGLLPPDMAPAGDTEGDGEDQIGAPDWERGQDPPNARLNRTACLSGRTA